MNTTERKFTLASGITPDPLASYAEKLDPQYGLKYAMTIQQEWFNGGMITKDCDFMSRHNWVREMRLYNRGEQGIQPYKDIAARQNEDLEWMNMDWTIINVLNKFNNVVRNGISDENYNLDIRSADRFSLLQREKNILRHKKNMANKEMFEKAKAMGLPDLMPQGFIPEDEEEMTLYSEIKERPKQEIAEEILIKFVKNVSGWNHIKKETDKDAVLVDLQVARVYTDPNNGVMATYVDPENFVHSYTEKNDFSDTYYFGVVDTITINDIRRESGYSDTVCREIAKTYSGDNSQSGIANFDECDMDQLLDFKIQVLRFTFKSDKKQIYKAYYDRKGKLKKVSKRDENYEVPEGSEKSKLEQGLDTWYEGNYIVGSDKYVYGYKESENTTFDDMDRVLPPFIAQASELYKNKLRSFQSNVIPIANQMQYVHLKMQHLMSELKPDLIELDIDQLAQLTTDMKDGDSKQENWKMALSILNAKGVVLKKRIQMGDEGIKDGASARPMGNQQGSALTILLNLWAHYYNLIRETTGINPAMDGSLSEDALVGVNQLMKLAGNSATKHIADAAVSFDKRVSETISSRLKSIFTLKKEASHLIKMYEQAVGKHNVDALETLKNRSNFEFGFTVELVPSKEELAELREDLGIALNEGTIDVSEKSDIMRIARGNMKQAVEYMRFVRTRKIKERMKENAYNQKLQSQSNAEAAQVKMQGDLQLLQMKAQIELQKEGNLSTLRVKEHFQKLQVEAPIRQESFQQDVYIEQIKNLQTINLTKYKEDAKSDREIENSTRQSKMIDQRLKDKGPIDFSKKFSLESLIG
ncbi:portal protein [Cellulophaga phage phi19:3]|uniref:Structural protein n=1 Tax=Cellulophaga phage phi19:3 TaxID=1327971 RepID=R9ZZW8_9CAUD|nr:portal protein [Cellulophaga phage phi19:3]AGO47508.1 structural protein [Cellulophaga phage phi19:3]